MLDDDIHRARAAAEVAARALAHLGLTPVTRALLATAVEAADQACEGGHPVWAIHTPPRRHASPWATPT